MGRFLEPIEAQVLLKCAAAREKAVKQAAKEIQKDFKQKVFDQAVSDYYEDYSPSRYKRTEGLYNAFKVKAPTDGRLITIEYDWNYSRLPRYKSNSELHQSGGEWIGRYDPRFDPEGSDNGIPEKGWIFTNFMEGIHPRFYIDKKLGIIIDDSVQFEPSYLRIRDYKNEYIEGNYAKDILIDNLQKQYKKL